MGMARYKRIVIKLRRRVKGQLRKLMQTTTDARFYKRLNAVVLYAEGKGTEEIGSVLKCSTSTPIRAANHYLAEGLAGLLDRRAENGEEKVDDDVRAALAILGRTRPQDYGWERSTWTTELLAKQLDEMTRVRLSVTTVGRLLHEMKARWGRPRPIVLCPWSKRQKTRRVREIEALIENLPPDEVVLYEDEVDIHLNPKIGYEWMFAGEQNRVVTPGNNVKRCVAGGLDPKTHRILWVVGDRRNSELFLQFLRRVVEKHPEATRIHVILDNCKAHTSQKVQKALKEEFGGIIQLHFLPPYSPEHNPIERLWGELHANVTRNHRCKTIEELLDQVKRFLRHASPFPGSRPSLAKRPRAAG
jgi:transposase